MAKIQIAALRKNKDKLLQFLQEEEVVHVEENGLPGAKKTAESQTGYLLAQVQFGLEFINTIQSRLHIISKRNFKNLFAPKPAATLQELEATLQALNVKQLLSEIQQANEELTELDAKVLQLEDRIQELAPWKQLALTGAQDHRAPVIHALLVLKTHEEDRLLQQIHNIPSSLWQIVHRETSNKAVVMYGELIIHEQDTAKLEDFIRQPGVEQVELTLEANETIGERLEKLERELTETSQKIKDTLQTAKRYIEKRQRLQFAYDALLHHLEREEQEQRLAELSHTVVLTGWIPQVWIKPLQKKLTKEFPEAYVQEISPLKDEKPPVALVNTPNMQPFEAVTNIYGKPAHNEIDPSPALSLFFLIAFGLALTDAGYGILMIIGMWAAQKFFRLKREMRKMVRLLFYAGFATTILGALTGGWFGVTLENLPAGALKDALLSMKVIDPVQDPISLLFVAFAIGIAQLLFAWVVRGYSHWKSDNKLAIFLDDIPWITMVVFILLWAGAAQGVLPAELRSTLGWIAVVNAGFLVLTQGRESKNPFIRLGIGIISLYGLVSFLSDTLSYSRLLALGLATAIIGLVVNLIASMVWTSLPPALGIIATAIVLLIGHSFNLGINALGAFIHSGRLQFVEFFPKFMEGGGRPFKPLGRVSKYVDNPREFT